MAEVCFLRLPPGFPAVPLHLSHTFGCGLGLWGFALSGPPIRSLSLRPGDSLTSLKDCFVDGLQILGFPPICHPSYRVPDSYPGRTNSCQTCQPLLDTQPDKRISHTSGSSANHSDCLQSTTWIQVFADNRFWPPDVVECL